MLRVFENAASPVCELSQRMGSTSPEANVTLADGGTIKARNCCVSRYGGLDRANGTTAPGVLVPWLEAHADPSDARTPLERTTAQVEAHQQGLAASDITESAVARYAESTDLRVITPGSSAGELLHVLSSLERRSERWSTDPESARAALSAAVSLLLRLLGRDPDPAKSREHVLLSVLAERRLASGEPAELSALLDDLAEPPIARIGALELNEFLPRSERKALAAALNTLLASPTFASWRQGATLDIGAWLTPKEGRTPAVANVVKKLAPRWFLMRDAHAREGMVLLKPRWAISLMLGPMTRTEIRRARGHLERGEGEPALRRTPESTSVPGAVPSPERG